MQAYASKADWQTADPAFCRNILEQVRSGEPGEAAWQMVVDLLGAWPEVEEVSAWVRDLEPDLLKWPWQIRTAQLGQNAFRNGKLDVYRLVGYLYISKIEDTFGQKLRRWAANPHWVNLRGLHFFQVETDPQYLAELTASPYLQGLEMLSFQVVDHLRGGLDLIFAEGRLPHLRDLRLRGLDLTNDDFQTLLSLPICQQIESLDLRGNLISPDELEQLFDEKLFPELKVLDLGSWSVQSGPLLELLESKRLPNLEEVRIGDTPASDQLGPVWWR